MWQTAKQDRKFVFTQDFSKSSGFHVEVVWREEERRALCKETGAAHVSELTT